MTDIRTVTVPMELGFLMLLAVADGVLRLVLASLAMVLAIVNYLATKNR